MHKYLYTHDDPVNGIDPSGKSFGVVGGALATIAVIGIASTLVTPAAIIGGITGGLYYGYTGYLTHGWKGAISYGTMGVVGGAVAGVGAVLGGTILFLFGSPIIIGGAIFTVAFYWGEYLWFGAPTYPTREQMAIIDSAKQSIRSSNGFSSWNVPSTVLIMNQDDWPLDKRSWGMSPVGAPFSIYLNKDIFDIPEVFIASTMVHEAYHQTQFGPAKPITNRYYGEYYAHKYQSDYLKANGIHGSVQEILKQFSNNTTQTFKDYLGGLASDFKDYGIENPAITH